MREYVFGLSIITMIIGLFLLFMGALWFGFRNIVEDNNVLQFISNLENWNAYLLVAGLIIFGIGLYYLYSYLNNRKFALEELKTDKRSEFLKKHNELKNIVKYLPSKYQKMLKDKEDELGVK
jgi:dipeptide/tripeptide permease